MTERHPTSRMTVAPAWLVVGIAAMAVSLLHIVIDFGVGLFDLRGTLAPTEAAVLLGIVLIHVWWVVSFIAGVQGNGGGLLSIAVLALVWSSLTNGFPIVYCPPTCHEAYPLSDIAHIGSLAAGPIVTLVVLWTLWRERPRIGLAGWILPLIAAMLAVGTVVSLANSPIS